MALWRADVGDKPALSQAFAAYAAVLCPDDAIPTPDPYFESYWNVNSNRIPYLFGPDDPARKPLGFVFVIQSQEPDLDFEMAEFCVEACFRKNGIGTTVLPLVFARHPGRWELSVLRTNADGLAFWPRALARLAVDDLTVADDPVARTFRFLTR